jgi:hypothetical protein
MVYPITPAAQKSGDHPWESLQFTNTSLQLPVTVSSNRPFLANFWVLIAETKDEADHLPQFGITQPFAQTAPPESALAFAVTVPGGTGGALGSFLLDPGFARLVASVAVTSAPGGAFTLQLTDGLSTYRIADAIAAGGTAYYDLIFGGGDLVVQPSGAAAMQMTAPSVLSIPRPVVGPGVILYATAAVGAVSFSGTIQEF